MFILDFKKKRRKKEKKMALEKAVNSAVPRRRFAF